MSVITTLSIFLPLTFTVLVALAGVFVFRGKYYQSLAKRLDEVEEREQRGYLENQRLRSENETLRRLVTGEVALEQLVELNRLHEIAADKRQKALIDAIIENKKMLEALVRNGD